MTDDLDPIAYFRRLIDSGSPRRFGGFRWNGQKVGPNGPCPCGSLKKFKRCYLDRGTALLAKGKIPGRPHARAH